MLRPKDTPSHQLERRQNPGAGPVSREDQSLEVLNKRKVATKAIKFIERIGILKQFRTQQPADELNAGGRL
jgi:hypothetical protein